MASLGPRETIPGGKPLAITLLASFGLLIVAGCASIVLALQAADAEQWVAHTLEVRRLNEALLARVQDATLGERGYIITLERRYFDHFVAAETDALRLQG